MTIPRIHSKAVLDAVEKWAHGYWLIRETSIVPVDSSGDGVGRLDGLLVPIRPDAWCMTSKAGGDTNFWDRICLLGIEVKVSRSDFLTGLRSNQYQRYGRFINGLYLATPRGVCDLKETPKGLGRLMVHGLRHPHEKRALFPGEHEVQGIRCVCSRHPKIDRSITYGAETVWRLLFAQMERYEELRREIEHQRYRISQTIGARVRNELWPAIDGAIQRIDRI